MAEQTQKHKTPVCLTGANGFIGTWLVRTLLDRGYATVLPDGRCPPPRPPRHGGARGRRGLRRRRRLPRGVPCTLEDPQTELVVPAVLGTLNVLAAAKMFGIRRVVLTSSISALVPNRTWPRDKVFDESSWTDLDY